HVGYLGTDRLEEGRQWRAGGVDDGLVIRLHLEQTLLAILEVPRQALVVPDAVEVAPIQRRDALRVADGPGNGLLPAAQDRQLLQRRTGAEADADERPGACGGAQVLVEVGGGMADQQRDDRDGPAGDAAVGAGLEALEVVAGQRYVEVGR